MFVFIILKSIQKRSFGFSDISSLNTNPTPKNVTKLSESLFKRTL